MTITSPEAWVAQLRQNPAIDKPRFAAIVQDLLAQDRAPFLRTLRRAETGSAACILAETLSLHQGLLAGPDPQQALHRAYLHLIVNTEAPIPEPPAPDFDLLVWARDYAALFDVGVDRPSPDGPLTIVVDEAFEFKSADIGTGAGAAALRELGQQINYRRYGRNDVIPSPLFDFDPASTRHTLGNALWLADLSQLVYLRPHYVKQQLRLWGWAGPDIHWMENRETDTQVLVAARDSHVVVAFRGTRGGADILTDLKFRKTDFAADAEGATRAGRVHRGFLGALDSVWPDVHTTVRRLARAHPDRPVFVCGHSLGAALATLAARRLVGHGQPVAGVYLYGSPRVGNDDFCSSYDEVLKDRTFLHVNRNDVVTRVPPSWLRFRHVAGMSRRFEAQGHAFSVEPFDDDPDPPADEQAEQATLDRLRWQAGQALDASQRYRDQAPPRAPSFYSASFERGAVDEHGIGEYLFKFACGLVDERLNSHG